MSHSNPFKFAICAAVCLWGVGAVRSANAQTYTVLGGLPGISRGVSVSNCRSARFCRLSSDLGLPRSTT